MLCTLCFFMFSLITLGETCMLYSWYLVVSPILGSVCLVCLYLLCVLRSCLWALRAVCVYFRVCIFLCVLSVHVCEHCLLSVYTSVFVSSCVFCVHVCEHCVLCVYTFRPLSIPRRSPSDVSPNKLQNVKSRLNFHSIFQLASHQRGLSAQPSPNLLWTSIGFLIQAEHWIPHAN